jgi:hypothetical protein
VSVSEPHVRITWHTVPPTPAQLAAWNWLWTRLLWGPDPKNIEATGTAIPEASTTCNPDGMDQAAPTASTSLTRPEEVSCAV